MKKYLTLALILVVVFIGVRLSAVSSVNSVLLDANRNPAKDGANCDVTTTTKVNIGDDLSTRVLATSTNRAWARVSVGNNATNTVFASFDEDAAAVLNEGFGLNLANTNGASSTPSIDFGITTVLPYIGSVTAITNFSTTTVLVTECVYS